jgi:ABC-type dipeptide/oligopeptide/nickel transport system permease subunit
MSNRRWVVLVAFAVVGYFAPHAPSEQYRMHAAVPPQCGSPCFLLGTDTLGRDVFSRVLHGARVSTVLGASSAAVALLLGVAAGGLVCFLPGPLAFVVSKPMELLMAIPWLLALLAFRSVLPLSVGPELLLPMLAVVLGLISTPGPFQLTRSIVKSVLTGAPLAASRGLGAGPWHLARRHLLPSLLQPLAAHAITLIPRCAVAEVSLSFLGLGLSDPAVSWGGMLATLRDYAVLRNQWWMLSPAVALTLFVALLRGDEAARLEDQVA